jgi:hypothetical protein
LYSVNSGHVGVCHDNVVSASPEKHDGLEPISRFIDPMAEKGYHRRQNLQNIRIVVHDQQFHGIHPPHCDQLYAGTKGL